MTHGVTVFPNSWVPVLWNFYRSLIRGTNSLMFSNPRLKTAFGVAYIYEALQSSQLYSETTEDLRTGGILSLNLKKLDNVNGLEKTTLKFIWWIEFFQKSQCLVYYERYVDDTFMLLRQKNTHTFFLSTLMVSMTISGLRIILSQMVNYPS